MACAFITGIAGFVGQHLCDQLLAEGHRVAGTDMAKDWARPGVSYHVIDIQDTPRLTEMLADTRPDHVYHLAAVSFPPDADKSPRNALEINIMGSVSVLDAVRAACPSATVLVIGSSKVYASSDTDRVVDEATPVAPSSFYGISKYSAELIGVRYTQQFALDVRFTRSFNHTGPVQSPRFVCSDWARQVARINAGAQKPAISVGDLETAIDFTDVRDVTRAYQAIVSRGKPGAVYNVCSGRTVPLKYVLDYLLAKAQTTVEVKVDTAKLRAHSSSLQQVGSNLKLSRDTGWKPSIPFERTLDDLFSYWEGMPE